MSAWQMTRLTLYPFQTSSEGMTNMGPTPLPSARSLGNVGTWPIMIGMWWAMMIAMMSPSAAPTILLYARVHRHAAAQGQIQSDSAASGAFLAGYLFIWLAFSIVAVTLQWILETRGIVQSMTMTSNSRWFSSAALTLAGLYQFSHLKNACLSHCRAPALFLARHWGPGRAGALRLGVMHGGYCIGCCWTLMAILFVGGVMNVVWIAGITLLILMEKLLAHGRWVGRAVGVVLLFWGAAMLLA